MTDDNIELPPLPPSLEGSALMLLMRDYAEQAVRLNLDRERRAKQEAIHGHNGRTRVVFD